MLDNPFHRVSEIGGIRNVWVSVRIHVFLLGSSSSHFIHPIFCILNYVHERPHLLRSHLSLLPPHLPPSLEPVRPQTPALKHLEVFLLPR